MGSTTVETTTAVDGTTATSMTSSLPETSTAELLKEQVDDGTWISVVAWARDFEGAAAQAEELDTFDTRILATNNYPSLSPGFWLVYIDASSTGPEAAESCREAHEMDANLFCVQALAADDVLQAAAGPPFDAWTVVLASLAADEEDEALREEAHSAAIGVAQDAVEAAQAIAADDPTLNVTPGVLLSGDYPTFAPGLWATYFGQFATSDEAHGICTELKLMGASAKCFVRALATWAQP